MKIPALVVFKDNTSKNIKEIFDLPDSLQAYEDELCFLHVTAIDEIT